MERLKRSRASSTLSASQSVVDCAPEPAVAAEAETPGSSVQVIHGASVQHLPLAGLRISDVRVLLHDILKIDRTSPILVNGSPARTNYRVVTGDCLEVVHHAGEKGASDGYANRTGWRPGRL
jgi:hypothetical protein